MFYETALNNHGLPYNPFKACVVPRPIGWISTLSPEGVVNLAPYSCFNQLAYDPPYVMFSGSNRPGGAQRKDTVHNVETTGEFVFNMATWALRYLVSRTSSFVDPAVDEFELAGLTKTPARLVAPPMVAESPVHFECRHHATLTLPSNRPETQHHVVIGQVIAIHIADEVITDGKVDLLKIRPLARLGYQDFTSVTEIETIRAEGSTAGMTGEAVAARR